MKKTMILALAVLGMVLGTVAEARSAPCTWVTSDDFGCHSYNCPSGCFYWVCPNRTNTKGAFSLTKF